jgi:hypothetical protein
MSSSPAQSPTRGQTIFLAVAVTLCLLTSAYVWTRSHRRGPVPSEGRLDDRQAVEKTIKAEKRILNRIATLKNENQDPKRAKELERAYNSTKQSLESHTPPSPGPQP